jgi:hypothetical protein
VLDVPSDVTGFTLEEVGDEDLVLVCLVGSSEDIGTLECLGVETEDIVDDENTFGGRFWTGDVCSSEISYMKLVIYESAMGRVGAIN